VLKPISLPYFACMSGFRHILSNSSRPIITAKMVRSGDERSTLRRSSRALRSDKLYAIRDGNSGELNLGEAIVEATNTHPIPINVHYSFARAPHFKQTLEDAINDQINIEYNVSYIYHSMYAFFSRDNVALDGFAQHFKKESLEERSHAELLMDYQTKRGGKVSLQAIMPPKLEFEHAEKGCGLYALELALSLEKLNYDKLLELHKIADECGDAAACDFIEGELLKDQIDSVKENAEMVASLTRMGADGPQGGLATWHFDKMLKN